MPAVAVSASLKSIYTVLRSGGGSSPPVTPEIEILTRDASTILTRDGSTIIARAS